MSNINKIKIYIEGLYDGEVPKHDQQCDFEDGYFTGISTILNFIDSLPEEKPSEDLEEAASRGGFDYVDEIEAKAPGLPWNDHDVEFGYRDGFIAGAEWQKKQQ